ncbi:MAG: hypothetical protein ACKVS8_10925 [Phycisphaerales bacterium]
MASKEINVSTRILNPPSERHTFRAPPETSLLQVMQIGATSAAVDLLPPGDQPFDRLHALGNGNVPGPVIEDLQQSIGTYLSTRGREPDFGIELVPSIRVNARWAVATAATMTPRQILTLFHLDSQDYSLYHERSAELLPIDTPVATSRGVAFEAQRDGKYGQE